MFTAILFSFISGVIGTTLGGIIGAIFGKKDKYMSLVLAFACGIMISVVFFDLIPEASEMSNIFFCILGLLLGIITIVLINFLIEKISKKSNPNSVFSLKVQTLKNNSMLKAGWIMFFAISIHNFPEGMAIGTSIEHNTSLGIALAILMAIHDIPEGMSISLPLIGGGIKKGKAILLTALSGVITIFGAMLGAFLGGLNDFVTAFALSFAGGAMLFVCFGEILPETILNSREKDTTWFCLLGIILGMIITNIL